MHITYNAFILINNPSKLRQIGYEHMLFSIALSGILAPRLFINLRKYYDADLSGTCVSLTEFHARTGTVVSHKLSNYSSFQY